MKFFGTNKTELPVEATITNMILYWAIVILSHILLIGVSIVAGSEIVQSREVKYYIIAGIIVLLAILASIYIVYAGFKDGGALCPKCGAKWSITYTDIETITEKVTTKRDSQGRIKHYRVGVERVAWKCEACKCEGKGEREYKKEA